MKRYQRYNKKKKPWRNLIGTGCDKKARKGVFKKYLYLSVCLEAAILAPRYGETVYCQAQSFFSVSQEAEAAEEEGSVGQDRKAGETREQGLSVDWKEGTVKLWRRVERVVLQDPD